MPGFALCKALPAPLGAFIKQSFSRIELFNRLQAFRDTPFRVVFLLVSNVVDNPRQVLRAETDYTISGLPLQHFVAGFALLVHIVS